MRIPGRQFGAGLDLLSIIDAQGRAVGGLVTLALTTVFINNHHLAGAGDDDLFVLGIGHVAHRRGKAHDTGAVSFDLRSHRRPRRRTTNVEGAHGELRSRLADRLRGNDADRLADVDHGTPAQIAAIAFGAQAVAGITGQRRTYLDFVDAQFFNQITEVFADQRAGLDHRFLGGRIDHVENVNAAKDTITQGLDDFTALDQRLHGHTILGAAIFLDDHQILRHVDQTAGQVTRVRRLQRGVGQTFTCAVRRDEVLENVEALAEVGGDRRFDNRAVRLGHQATHPGQLANLCRRTARAGIGHHVDRVEGFLLDLVVLEIKHLDLAELFHHHLGHLLAGTSPDIDHLVIALAIGHQTVGVLAFDFLDLFFGSGNDFRLLRRHQHVVRTDRDAGAGCQTIAVLHQLVGENHGFLESAATESGVDQLGDFLLFERLVEHAERQTLRQNFGKQGAAGRGLVTRQFFDPIAVLVQHLLANPHGNAGVQFKFAGLHGPGDFSQIGKHHAFALGVDPLAGGVVKTEHDVL